MDARHAYKAEKIFTGENWLTGHAILVSDGKVDAIIPEPAIPAGTRVEAFGDAMIVPALMDLQIYGAGNRLLAVYPDPEALDLLNQYCRSGGAAWCMPTVATNAIDVFHRCIDAIRSYWDQKGRGILGLHIEGPWINPVKRGAHIASFVHSPSLDEVKRLLDYGQDVIRIITLAPEVCEDSVIDYIQQRGIIVSAGHSNATHEQASRAFQRGIPVATHLYNAMSPLQHREPGLVGAVLNGSTVCSSIIPDGHHVDFAAVRIAKKIMGDRLFAITDAVTETNKGDYQHHLVGDKYEAGGILSGSALTMLKAVRNLVRQVGVEPGEAIRMCSLYPARIIHEEKNIGCLQPGAPANLLVLDRDLNMIRLVA